MGVNWRETKSLGELSPSEALLALGQITEALASPQTRETNDAPSSRYELLEVSPEAQELADAARRFHRRARAAEDCRPELRQVADERREALTADEDAAAYATAMRQCHRK